SPPTPVDSLAPAQTAKSALFLTGPNIVPPACLLAAFALGLWVARKVPERRVLHGALVGTVAMLIYVGMGLGQPEPVAYIVAHALKVVGGAAGGFVALKRATANAVSNAPPDMISRSRQKAL